MKSELQEGSRGQKRGADSIRNESQIDASRAKQTDGREPKLGSETEAQRSELTENERGTEGGER